MLLKSLKEKDNTIFHHFHQTLLEVFEMFQNNYNFEKCRTENYSVPTLRVYLDSWVAILRRK